MQVLIFHFFNLQRCTRGSSICLTVTLLVCGVCFWIAYYIQRDIRDIGIYTYSRYSREEHGARCFQGDMCPGCNLSDASVRTYRYRMFKCLDTPHSHDKSNFLIVAALMQNPTSEHSALLNPELADPRNKRYQKHIFTLFVFVLITEGSNFLQLAPMTVIMESIICKNYHRQANSTSGSYQQGSDARCKIEPIQSELAKIRGWQQLFDCLASTYHCRSLLIMSTNWRWKVSLFPFLLATWQPGTGENWHFHWPCLALLSHEFGSKLSVG